MTTPTTVHVSAISSFLRRISWLGMFIAISVFGQTPARTTISDQLAKPDGSPDTGTITITSNQTFTTPDNFVIPIGQRVVITLIAGSFSVSLVPNLGAVPTGTSYTADYATATKRFTETWIVPVSGTPIKLLAVRALDPPTPSILIPFPQNIPPPNCLALNRAVPVWTGTQWDCGNSNLGAVTMDLENPTGADSGKFQWKPKNPLRLTRITCSTDQGAASINLDIRQEGTPNASGTAVLAAPLACNSTTAVTTSIANANISGLSPVALLVASASGGVTVVRVHAEYQLNP